MRHGIRRFPALWRATRLARRWYHARHGAYPDWTELLSAPGEAELWRAAKASAQGGPRVLIATAIGSYAHAVTLESALAMALTFRHAEVHVLLCDGTLTACAECEASLYPNLDSFAQNGPSKDLCKDCLWPAEKVYSDLGITVHRLGTWLHQEDRAQARAIATTIPAGAIESYVFEGMAVGEHAHAGALRFFATGSLEGEQHGEAILRRYLESALLTALASRRLMRAITFSSVVLTHDVRPGDSIPATCTSLGFRLSNPILKSANDSPGGWSFALMPLPPVRRSARVNSGTSSRAGSRKSVSSSRLLS